MKQTILFTLTSLCFTAATAQPFTAEALAGNDYLFYQHYLAKKFTAQSRFGVMHIANIITRYEQDPKRGGKPNELMNQAYLTTKITQRLTLLTGMFYNNVTGIRAAIGMQYALPFKNGLWVLVPRADLQHHGSAEMMSMLEFQPLLAKKVKLYTRLQVMTNYGPWQHNRSYQRIRLGVTIKHTQLGLGLNIDEYGKAPETRFNTGIFVRKEIF